jgi:hypothetical protein
MNYSTKSGVSAHFYIDTAGAAGGGILDIDGMYLTSSPGAIPDFPTGARMAPAALEIGPKVLTHLFGRSLAYVMPPKSTLEIVDLHGRIVGWRGECEHEQRGVIAFSGAGFYVARSSRANVISIQRLMVK